MADSHLTLRLPTSLARLLARRAAAHHVPKSQLVREAVTRYLEGATSHSAPSPDLSARECARRWRDLPRLLAEEANGLAEDIAASRDALLPPATPWE